MTKQFTAFIITIFIAFIVCFSLLYVLLKSPVENEFLQVGEQSAYYASVLKTKMKPLNASMSDLLDGGRIVSTNKTSAGLIFILESNESELVRGKRRNVICTLILPNPKKGQYEATSRCWLLN